MSNPIWIKQNPLTVEALKNPKALCLESSAEIKPKKAKNTKKSLKLRRRAKRRVKKVWLPKCIRTDPLIKMLFS